MPTIYKAILRGDTLEWDGDAPAAAHAQQAVAVQVVVPDSKADDVDSKTVSVGSAMLDAANAADPTRGQRAADALRALAALNPFADVDAAAWEREIRKDRPLPGRE